MEEVVIYKSATRVFDEAQRRLYLYNSSGDIKYIESFSKGRVEPDLIYRKSLSGVVQAQYKWAANCSHLMYDVLSDYIIGKRCFGRDSILLKPNGLSKSMLEYLGCRIEYGSDNIEAVNLYDENYDFLRNPWRHSGMKHEYITNSLRDAFGDLMLRDESFPVNIIINRRPKSSSYGFTHCRNFSNVDEFLSDALNAGFGIKAIDMEDYSFKDQIKLFFNAKNIISVHGSALAWLTFCRPGTNVVEIMTPYFRKNNFVKPDFWYISQNCKLNHACVSVDEPYVLGDGMHPYDHDVSLNWKFFRNLFNFLNA